MLSLATRRSVVAAGRISARRLRSTTTTNASSAAKEATAKAQATASEYSAKAAQGSLASRPPLARPLRVLRRASLGHWAAWAALSDDWWLSSSVRHPLLLASSGYRSGLLVIRPRCCGSMADECCFNLQARLPSWSTTLRSASS